MGALSRERLSNRHGSSVFYHVLEGEGGESSASDELQDWNFRGLVCVSAPAWWFVHLIVTYGFPFLTSINRFLPLFHLTYMPECGNWGEEGMLGVLPPHYYCEVTPDLYSDRELVQGDHLIFSEQYYHAIYSPIPLEEMPFVILFQYLQINDED